MGSDRCMHVIQTLMIVIAFLPETIFGLRVLLLPASVCVRVFVCTCQSVCQSLACPRDNSGLVQARITKFETKVQNNSVKIPIVLWNDLPWPARLNFTLKSKFALFCAFWVCPRDKSQPIEVRVSKFGPKMHLNTVKVPIDFGIDWHWS